MEPLNQLKRRSTKLFKQAQQNIPSLPLPNLQKGLPSLSQVGFGKKSTNADITSGGIQGTWERIDIPALPRSSHSLNVISGCAYIFGGEIEPRDPVDNDMHIIRLPFSSAGADYHKVAAAAAAPSEQQATTTTPESGASNLDDVAVEESTSKGKGKEIATDDKPDLGDVPCPRVGHATAVIGSRIFLFGGRGGPDMKPLEEAGRVWVYDTRSHKWSYLDPVPAVKGGSIVPHPAPRSYHCATASDLPQDFPRSADASAAAASKKKPQTWRQWAIGDTSKTGIPQDPVVGYVAEQAVDQDSDGYGTFFVHAGCFANGDRTSDLWAFDVRTCTWTELPAAPGPARGGAAICISKSRLFRFGGFDGESQIGGQLDFLHLELETFDDGFSKGEVSIKARTPWQAILQDDADASTSEIHAEPSQEWPAPRSVASLQALTLGGGKEYLVLSMGERDPSANGHAEAGTFFDDVWMFQVPPLGMTPASFTAAVFQAVGRSSGEGKWEKVTTRSYDTDRGDGMPLARGWLASAPMTDLEEAGIIIWGGLGSDNKRIGDGWMLRLGN